MIRRIAIAAAFATVALLPAAGHAVTQQGFVAMKRWTAADRCAQAAQKAYPDYTAEAIAKRNQSLQQCLSASGLPPRDLPPPTKP
jgi:hypothetical protein